MKTAIIKLITFLLLVIIQNKGFTQSLDSLMQLAIQQNIELKSVEAEYQSILTRQDQVSQLPNPQIGLGVPILRPETRLGPQVMMISAQQMFPWFGTLDSKKEVVLSMSKVKYEQLSVIKLDLFFQLKRAYFKLIFIDQKEKVLLENMAIFESMEAIALAKIESGKTSGADVLRIQTRLDLLKAQINKLENERKAQYASINYLLNVAPEEKVNITENLDYQLTDYDLETFRSKIENHHPMIKQLDYKIETSKNKLEVNQNMNKPIIGLGMDYNLVQPRTDANPMNNGRDILTPKLMVSIPIYRKSYQAVVEEESLQQQSFLYQKENLTDKMINMIIGYKAAYDNAQIERDLALVQMQKTQAAYNIIVADYSSSGRKFEELLATQNELVQLNLKIHISELEMALAKINIERITDF